MQVGAYEAKTKLSELLVRVEAGETVTVTRRGKVIAQIVPPLAARIGSASQAVEEIKKLRGSLKLTREEIRDYIDAGRK